MHFFPKTGRESCLKRNLEYENILYSFTELSVDSTSEDIRDFKIKLHYFQEKLSFTSKRTNFQKDLQSWTNGWRQIDETKQNRFFYGMFYS